LTLTFDPAIRHVVLHQSSTSTYIPNFIQIEETFCGRTDISPLFIIRSTLGSRPNNNNNEDYYDDDGIEVEFNVPLDTLQVILETVLRVT